MSEKRGCLYARLIPVYSRLALLLVPVWNCAVYYGARQIAGGLPHRDLTMAADAGVPFLPWTVSIYFLSFLFWVVSYCFGARRAEDKAYRLFTADLMGKLVCLVFFIAMPTTNQRPEVTGTGLWDGLMRLLYRIDAPNNLFPSIHCFMSVLCALAVMVERRIPLWYRIFAPCMAAAIFFSTLSTRQHVLPDVIAGVALALAVYAAAGVPRIWQTYRRGVMAVQTRLFPGRRSAERPPEAG